MRLRVEVRMRAAAPPPARRARLSNFKTKQTMKNPKFTESQFTLLRLD